MSQDDKLSTYEVNTSDNKISKLETIINQTRIGFYTLLFGTMSSFAYGIYTQDDQALEIGRSGLLPIIGWMGMYIGLLINKKD